MQTAFEVASDLKDVSKRAAGNRPERLIAESGMSAVRGRILVVDDEPEVACMIARYLTRRGYHSHYHCDPRTAMAAARSFRPDLCILDLHMPFIVARNRRQMSWAQEFK